MATLRDKGRWTDGDQQQQQWEEICDCAKNQKSFLGIVDPPFNGILYNPMSYCAIGRPLTRLWAAEFLAVPLLT